jgi:hypothetical protein
MTVSIYDASIPSLVRGLTNLSAILDKAAAHAAAHKFDPAVLLQARLFPDMLPLTRQIQIVCDTAKGAAGRLAAKEVPKHEDNEASIAELKARIQKTIDFVQSVTPEALAGAETRPIVLTFPTNTLNFNGLSYLTHFVLPNFYFHVSIAYALLRNNGVELGKRDYLGAIQ